ncbi:MAG: hypothetical protein AAGD96_09325 [Chloroflexota bacterium]
MNVKSTREREGMSTSSILILFLSLITGVIHFLQDDPILKLNGVGYFLLAVGVVFRHKDMKDINEAAPKILIVYAVTTIAMFFVLNGETALEHRIGLATKAIEFLLIGVLLVHQRAMKRAAKQSWTAYSAKSKAIW